MPGSIRSICRSSTPTLDDWREVFETNVVGLVAMTKAAIPVLRANTPAVVCNVSSSSILA